MKVMGKTGKAEFDAFAEGFSFWAWTTSPCGSRGFDEAMSFLPQQVNRVLDAGCGSGVLALKLVDHVNYVVGVDISVSMISLARTHQVRLQKSNVNFVVADLENLPFKDGTFDFVVSNMTLHDTQMDVTLPALFRLVRPRGRIVICDLVTSTPRLDASPLWQILRVIRSAPGYAILHGLRTMWRLVSFQLSPAWIAYVCDPKNKKLTPESFKDIYSRFLPGCRFERNPKTPWSMTAFWETPNQGHDREG